MDELLDPEWDSGLDPENSDLNDEDTGYSADPPIDPFARFDQLAFPSAEPPSQQPVVDPFARFDELMSSPATTARDGTLDGDTLAGPGTPRIKGYDAPEYQHPGQTYEPGAVTSERYLQNLNAQGATYTPVGERDKYGRTIVQGDFNGRPLEDVMIEAGMAVPLGRDQNERTKSLETAAFLRRSDPRNNDPWDQAYARETQGKTYDIDLDRLNGDSVKPEGAWSRAIDRGLGTFRADIGGAIDYIGRKFDSDSMQNYGKGLMREGNFEAAINPPSVESWDAAMAADDTYSKVGTYWLEKVGENLAQLGITAASAWTGGLLSAGARAMFGRQIIREAMSAEAKRAASAQAFKWGARAGGLVPLYGQHLGESAEEMQRAGAPDSSVALLTAGVNAALDYAPMELLLKGFFKGLRPDMARDLTRSAMRQPSVRAALLAAAARVGKTATVQSIFEGTTETAQELALLASNAYVNPNFKWDTPENRQRIQESFIGGAMVGFSMGGAGGAVAETFRPFARDQSPPASDTENGTADTTALPPPDTSGGVNNDTVIPETEQQLYAQYSAVLDPTQAKDTMLVTGPDAPRRFGMMASKATQAQREAIKKTGAARVNLGRAGVLFSSNPEKIAEARKAARRPESITQEMLNRWLYDGAGSTTKEGDQVFQAEDAQGNVITQLLADSQDLGQLESARALVEEHTPRGGVAVTQSLEEAVNQRAAQGEAAATSPAGQTEPGMMPLMPDGIGQWDRDNRTRRSDSWFEGYAETINQRNAEAERGSQYVTHGMAKAGTLSGALADLVNILYLGLDPKRGGGRLHTAPLAVATGSPSGGQTASGAAYADGPFQLVAHRGANGIRGSNDIGGVLVNESVADTGVIEYLKQQFPYLVVERYSNISSFLDQMDAAAQTSSASTTTTTVENGVSSGVSPTTEIGETGLSGSVELVSPEPRAKADAAGLTDRVTELYAEGRTTQEVADDLGAELTQLGVSEPKHKDFIDAVRVSLGIPTRETPEQSAGFRNWLAAYRQQNPVPPAAGAPTQMSMALGTQEKHPNYDAAVALVREKNSATLALLKSTFGIKDASAQQLMQELERYGVVSAKSANNRRTVLEAPPPPAPKLATKITVRRSRLSQAPSGPAQNSLDDQGNALGRTFEGGQIVLEENQIKALAKRLGIPAVVIRYGVALHELGGHIGFEALFGSGPGSVAAKIIARINELGESGDVIAQRALERTRRANGNDQDLVGYFAEEAVIAEHRGELTPQSRTVWARIKDAVRRMISGLMRSGGVADQIRARLSRAYGIDTREVLRILGLKPETMSSAEVYTVIRSAAFYALEQKRVAQSLDSGLVPDRAEKSRAKELATLDSAFNKYDEYQTQKEGGPQAARSAGVPDNAIQLSSGGTGGVGVSPSMLEARRSRARDRGFWDKEFWQWLFPKQSTNGSETEGADRAISPEYGYDQEDMSDDQAMSRTYIEEPDAEQDGLELGAPGESPMRVVAAERADTLDSTLVNPERDDAEQQLKASVIRSERAKILRNIYRLFEAWALALAPSGAKLDPVTRKQNGIPYPITGETPSINQVDVRLRDRDGSVILHLRARFSAAENGRSPRLIIESPAEEGGRRSVLPSREETLLALPNYALNALAKAAYYGVRRESAPLKGGANKRSGKTRVFLRYARDFQGRDAPDARIELDLPSLVSFGSTFRDGSAFEEEQTKAESMTPTQLRRALAEAVSFLSQIGFEITDDGTAESRKALTALNVEGPPNESGRFFRSKKTGQIRPKAERATLRIPDNYVLRQFRGAWKGRRGQSGVSAEDALLPRKRHLPPDAERLEELPDRDIFDENLSPGWRVLRAEFRAKVADFKVWWFRNYIKNSAEKDPYQKIDPLIRAASLRNELRLLWNTIREQSSQLPASEKAQVKLGELSRFWSALYGLERNVKPPFVAQLEELRGKSDYELGKAEDALLTLRDQANKDLSEFQKEYRNRVDAIRNATSRKTSVNELGVNAEDGSIDAGTIDDTSASDTEDGAAGSFAKTDTRGQAPGFQTDANDLAAMSKSSTSRTGQSLQTGPMVRPASDTQDSRLAGEAAWMSRLLKWAGVQLNNSVTLIDDAALANAPQSGDYNAGLINQTLADKPPARVMFMQRKVGTDKDGNSINRVKAVIYVSDAVSGTRRNIALIHEIGHVVMRHYLATASKASLRTLARTFGEPGSVDFEENFADSWVRFVYAQQVADKKGLRPPIHDPKSAAWIPEPIRAMFENIYRALWSVYRAARRTLGPAYDQKWEDFIESLVNRRRYKEGVGEAPMISLWGQELYKAQLGDVMTGELADLGENQFLDFTPFNRIAANTVGRAVQRAMGTGGGRALQTMWSGAKSFHKTWLKALDTKVREVGTTPEGKEVANWIADQFRREAGKAQTDWRQSRNPMIRRLMRQAGARRGTRVIDDIRAMQGPFETALRSWVEQHVPDWQPWHAVMGKYAPKASNVWTYVSHKLVHGKAPNGVTLSPAEQSSAQTLEAGIRKWLDQIWRLANKSGVRVQFRQNYFPRMWSHVKILQDNSGDFVSKVLAWAQTPLAKQFWQDKYGTALTRQEAQKFARHLRNVLAGGDASVMEPDHGGLTFMAPGFGYKNQRVIPQDLADALGDYLEEDIIDVMSAYMKAAVKRAAWVNRFGDENARMALELKMANIAKREWTRRGGRSDAEIRLEITKQIDQLIEQETNKNFGVNPLDAAANLKVVIERAFQQGHISFEDYEFLNNEAVPSYLGQLGADFVMFGKPRPAWRHLAAMISVYQTLRVLSLGVLSQTQDFATSMARIPNQDRWRLVKTSFAALVSGKTRAELRQLSMDLNRWEHRALDHVLGDEAGIQALGAGARRLQEWFFQMNGMQWLTNWTRAIDLSTGKDIIEDWAKRGATRELSEIGLTVQDVNSWIAAGRPTKWGRFDNVLSGLNQLVDEMILSPDAATKPRWGNDARLGLIFHLKSFIYAFQLQVLDRAYNQMRARWGSSQGAARFYAIAPYLALAAFTLPMAALAMELRWLISPPKNGEPKGLDYVWEVINRSGLLGLASIGTDMIETESHGKLSLIAPLGPTASQLYDLGTRDWWTEDGPGSVLTRSLPAYPILGFLHDVTMSAID